MKNIGGKNQYSFAKTKAAKTVIMPATKTATEPIEEILGIYLSLLGSTNARGISVAHDKTAGKYILFILV